MDFRTKIEIPKPSFDIDYQQPILLLGSCFAEHIGAKLAQGKLPVTINPFGIQYNPLSVAQSLQRLLANSPIEQAELFNRNGRWHSFLHHSRFSHHDATAALEGMNGALITGAKALHNASYLFITFGTSYVYYHNERGSVVANCHKLPEAAFTRSRLTVDEVVTVWTPLIEELHLANPSLRILFTVSPIRHLRDGAHGNQLSKAVLLLAIDALCQKYPDMCHYFPSYELVMDELRDYRFYNDDMVHPSTVAVDYIWQQFITHYFTPATLAIYKEWLKLDKLIHHRPLTTDATVYNNFINQNIVKVRTFQEKYPYIHLKEELQRLESSLLL